jgi:hypothetical protein
VLYALQLALASATFYSVREHIVYRSKIGGKPGEGGYHLSYPGKAK